MSMFKTLFGIERKALNLAKEGFELATKTPSATSTEIEEYWQKVERVGRSSTDEAVREAKYQIEAHLKKYLSTTTMTALQAEKQLHEYWDRLLDSAQRAESIRVRFNDPNYGREMPKWMRVLAITGGVIFSGWFVIGLANAPSATIPSIQQQTVADAQKHVNDFHDAQTAITASTITVSTSDFESMFDTLEAPTPVDEPPVPAAAVAPIEAEPVTIEKESPEGNRSYTTTIGKVYQAAPSEIRQEMEAPKIDHGYDHPDPHDCFVNHCLTPHKDFTVTADFDSGGKQTAHVRY